MPDYQKGKVYRILQDNEKTVYIGSTTQELSARMGQHRKGLKYWPNLKLYKLMAEVGVDRFSIELIVDVPCDRREILNRAEGEQIRLHGTIIAGANQVLPGRTQAEYAQLPEQKAYRLEYDQRPEVKARKAERERLPVRKAQKAEYVRLPEVMARRRELSQVSERKTRKKEYSQRPERKAKDREYSQRPERKAKVAEYVKRPEVKEKAKAYRALPEVKARFLAYQRSPEMKAKAAEYYQRRKNGAAAVAANLNGAVNAV